MTSPWVGAIVLAMLGMIEGTTPHRFEHLERLHRDGYAIARRVFAADEIVALGREFDRLQEDVHRGTLSPEIQCFRSELGTGGPLRFLRRDGYVSAFARAWCQSSRLREWVEPVVTRDAMVATNGLFYKHPGICDDAVGYHQDAAFRRPPTAFAHFGSAWIHVGVAVDRHGPACGGLEVVIGSHLKGLLPPLPARGVSKTALSVESLRAAGLDPDARVTLELDPGDVAFWTPLTVHGSPPNLSDRPRRFFTLGFARADCARVGDIAFPRDA